MPNAPLFPESSPAMSPPYFDGPSPPGQQRAYPKPTKTGRIPFEYPQTGLKGETSYLLWGELSAATPPLVCLHGGPGAGHDYLLPISLISQDYGIPVVMYDQIGCGGSTRFKDKKGDGAFWTVELFMAELDNLKAHLGIQDFHLLGQSWGGMLGGQYAAEKQPPGLRKLVISNSPADMVLWVKVANELRAGLPADVQATLTRCERDGTTASPEYEHAVLHFYHRHLCRVDPFPAEVTATLANLGEDATVYETMNGPSEFYVIGTLKKWSLLDALPRITDQTCPGGLLVMNGDHDEAQDETCVAYWARPRCRTKWVRYPLSSHMPMLEETERYLQDLGTFLTAP